MTRGKYCPAGPNCAICNEAPVPARNRMCDECVEAVQPKINLSGRLAALLIERRAVLSGGANLSSVADELARLNSRIAFEVSELARNSL